MTQTQFTQSTQYIISRFRKSTALTYILYVLHNLKKYKYDLKGAKATTNTYGKSLNNKKKLFTSFIRLFDDF